MINYKYATGSDLLSANNWNRTRQYLIKGAGLALLLIILAGLNI